MTTQSACSAGWPAPPGVRRHAPLLGENTRELLAEAGYAADEIERLLAKGAARETAR